MQDQALRIDLPDGQFSGQQRENLFWIKSGYVYYVSGAIVGESAARAIRILELMRPVQEVESISPDDLDSAEEVFYVEPTFDLLVFPKFSKSLNWPVVAVRQIEKMQFGNIRVFSRMLRKELAEKP